MEGIYLNVSVNMYHFMRINNEVTVARGFFQACVIYQTCERITIGTVLLWVDPNNCCAGLRI